MPRESGDIGYYRVAGNTRLGILDSYFEKGTATAGGITYNWLAIGF